MPKPIPQVYRRARRRAASVRSTMLAASTGMLGMLGGPMSQAGVYITPATAMNYSAVFAAINIIATDCATLPTNVYAKLPDMGRRIDPAHPLADLLQFAPNGEVDAIHLLQCWYADALRQGNGYLEIVRDPDTGAPLRLYRIAPEDCEPTRNDVGRLVYKLSSGKLLLPENVLHLKGLTEDGIVGIAIIARARQTIGVGTASEISAASMFGNGPNMPGFLKTEKPLKEGAQERANEYFDRKHAGPYNAGRAGILVGDWTWVSMGVSPQDGQFLATRAFNVVEIARWFNINPIKLMDFTNGRFNNIEQAQDDHVTTTLLPWLTFAETELNLKLLTPADRQRWEIRHDLDARLRGDSTARWNNYKSGFSIGCLNRNEIRQRESLNPIPGGDDYYVATNNMSRVGDDGDPKPADDGNPRHAPTFVPADQYGRDRNALVDAALETFAP